MSGRLLGLEDRPHTIYFHRDKTGAVIYVGCTARFEQRTREHMKGSKHRREIASVEIESIQPGYIAGRLREAQLIREHQPRHNVYVGFVELWETRQIRDRMSNAEWQAARRAATEAAARLDVGAVSA